MCGFWCALTFLHGFRENRGKTKTRERFNSNFFFHFSVNSTGNGAAVPSRLPLDGDISNNRNKDRILSPPSINRMSLGSSHVVASTTITNLDSASQKFKLVSTFIALVRKTPIY